MFGLILLVTPNFKHQVSKPVHRQRFEHASVKLQNFLSWHNSYFLCIFNNCWRHCSLLIATNELAVM